jgi:hypothetical protein
MAMSQGLAMSWTFYVRPLQPLIDDRWTDEEIFDRAAQGSGFDLRARHELEAEIAELRGTRASPAQPRKPGRRWTVELFAKHWAEACTAAGEPYTYAHVAGSFRLLGSQPIDLDPDYLGKLWRKHGRPDPKP